MSPGPKLRIDCGSSGPSHSSPLRWSLTNSIVSAIDTSIDCPAPVCSRWYSAARMAVVSSSPVYVSAWLNGSLEYAAAVGVALHLGDPRLGGDDRGVGPPVDPRAGGAVAADRGVDQPREAGRHLLGAEPEPLHHAGPVVLDEHVALPGQLDRQLDAAGRAEVDAHVALADVLLDEVRRQPVDARAGEAGQVTGRRLDLDHLGPEVRQHPRAVRTGQDAGQIEDTDTVERTTHGSVTVGHRPVRRRWGRR